MRSDSSGFRLWGIEDEPLGNEPRFAERLLDLSDLGALERPDLCGDLFHGRGKQGEALDEFGVTVALYDLVRDRRRGQAKLPAYVRLDLGRDAGIGAYRARQLADGDAVLRLVKPVDMPAEFGPPEGQFQAEAERFGVNAV